MTCYSPLQGRRSSDVGSSGKRRIFDIRSLYTKDGFRNSLNYDPDCDEKDLVTFPCGSCIGCLLRRSRDWAVRCIHEASLYEDNCFITLTYDEDNLPSDGSLDKSHFQKFMKRLRFHFGQGPRYFHCGEYGSKLERPHYHACLFNFDFPDKVLWSSRRGVSLYRSSSLERLWPYGFSTVGAVNFNSAAYVARYILKKKFGDNSVHYGKRLPEYTTMSRRPGIGYDWFQKFKSDVFPRDFVVVNSKLKVKPPRSYDRLLELTDPTLFSIIKSERVAVNESSEHFSFSRLKAREEIQHARVSKLIRGYENDS